MEDRIEINGIWYVKEDNLTKPDVKPDVKPLISEEEYSIGTHHYLLYENEYIALEAKIPATESGTIIDKNNSSIEFTDKTTKPWKEDYWDNPSWFRGIVNNNELSLKDIPLNVKHQQPYIVEFMQKLEKLGWL